MLLYASTDMHEASAALLRAQTEGLAELGRRKKGSVESTEALARFGLAFGNAFAARRKAASADLASPNR